MYTKWGRQDGTCHRYAPLPLSWNALCFYSVWTTRGWVYAVNLTFDLVSCAHVWMWLWTVLCLWHTHFWIFYDKQSKPLVAVCVCVWGGGCHCSGATPPSNGQITALHMWDSNAPTSGLNHTKSTRSAISAAIHKESVSGSVTLLIVLYVLILSDRRRFTPWASLLMWRVFNEELIWQRMIYSFKSSDSSRQLNSLSLFVGFVFLEW